MNAWYWVCDLKNYPELWKEWLARDVASIGWPPRSRGKEPDSRYDRALQRNLSTIGKMRSGDRIIAYLKRGRVAGVGTFTGDTWLDDRTYAPLAPGNEQGRTVRVKWDTFAPANHYCWAPEGVRLPTRGTLHRCRKEDLQTLQEAFSDENMLGPFVEADHLVREGRERKDLHPLIVTNLEALEEGLALWDLSQPTEFPAGPVGKMDVLAKDAEGHPVVVEAKTHIAGDSAVGQVARYMSWVRLNLGEPWVKGMLVAGEFPPSVRYAAASVATLSLHRYSVRNSGIEFHQVPVIGGRESELQC